MTDSLLTNLNQAVQKAKEKGSRDVVVIGESGAFIVNVPHNIVVTTMSGAEMKENIFRISANCTFVPVFLPASVLVTAAALVCNCAADACCNLRAPAFVI